MLMIPYTLQVRANYSPQFNKFIKFINLKYSSTLSEKLAYVIPVHKLSSKKVIGHIREEGHFTTLGGPQVEYPSCTMLW